MYYRNNERCYAFCSYSSYRHSLIKLSCKPYHPHLPTNDYFARKRTRNGIGRLAINVQMLHLYFNNTIEQKTDYFIEKVSSTEIDRKMDKSTTYHTILFRRNPNTTAF